MKEKFTTNIGLRNYVLGTGKPANVGNDTKLTRFQRIPMAGDRSEIKTFFDYQAEDAVKKFRINRVVRYKTVSTVGFYDKQPYNR